MKITPYLGLSILIASALVPSLAETIKAQEIEATTIAQRAIREPEKIEGNAPPSISNTGLLNANQDHYFDVLVKAEPLSRLKVECVNFHELDSVEVLNAESSETIASSIDYGFEEFTVTFDEAVPLGQEIRIVMKGSTVQGETTGIIVPYRVFGDSEALGTIPLGTALVRGATRE